MRNLDIRKISPIEKLGEKGMLPFAVSVTSVPIPFTSQVQVFDVNVGLYFLAREIVIKKASLRCVCIETASSIKKPCEFFGRISPNNGTSFKHNRDIVHSGSFANSSQSFFQINDNNEDLDLSLYWNINPGAAGLNLAVVAYPESAFGTLSIQPFWEIFGYYKI